jgi:hypothetical protein
MGLKKAACGSTIKQYIKVSCSCFIYYIKNFRIKHSTSKDTNTLFFTFLNSYYLPRKALVSACIHSRENTSDAWDIPWYTTRKHCITTYRNLNRGKLQIDMININMVYTYLSINGSKLSAVSSLCSGPKGTAKETGGETGMEGKWRDKGEELANARTIYETWTVCGIP